MNIDEQTRHSIIVALSKRSTLGRTAVMKFMFFLQEVRGLPLGYSFRIYTYGPYDSQVLEDLRFAEVQGGVVCNRVEWSGGSGVEITPGPQADDMLSQSESLISKFSNDLDWVIVEFGKKSASDLEIMSTIVFIDRAAIECINKDALASKVHAVKPHHNLSKINREIESLSQIKLLESLC